MQNTETRLSQPGQGIAGQRRSKNEIIFVFLLLLLCLTLFFFRLGHRPLWDVDEGKHAATSKNMVLNGDWITPTLNGEVFYDKPVLHNWLVAICFLVFGFTEFAARLPAAVLGVGGVFVTYLLGRRMFTPLVGFLGAVILATSVEYIIISRTIVHDSSLLFLITLVLFLLYLGYTREKYRKRFFLLAYASSGAAVLAKGPIGFLLPAMIFGIFLTLRGQLGFLKEMVIGWGMLVFLAVATPWYLLISVKDPNYAGYFFIKQNLGSFMGEEVHHSQPFYYFIPVLLGGFFPWSCLLPLAFIRSVRRRLKQMDDGRLFLLVWFGVIFIFFSMAKSKLPTYILPLFPAAALLVGVVWRDLMKEPTRALHKGFFYSILPLVVIFPLAMVLHWIHPLADQAAESGISLTQINVMALLLVGVIGISFFLFLKRKYRMFFCGFAGMIVGLILLFVTWVVPSINPFRSTKMLVQQVDHATAPGEALVFYRRVKESALFYSNRRVRVLMTPQQLTDYLASSHRVFCIITRKKLEKLNIMPYVVDRDGDKLIISNKKLPNPDPAYQRENQAGRK